MRDPGSAALERVVADLVERVERRYFGKYRALVVDNADPAQLGRLRLQVPSVLGPEVVTGWAAACVPYGGAAGQGLMFIPDTGAGVWAEFEEGDLEFPIWVGSYWSRPGDSTELPAPAAADGTPGSSPQDPPTCKIIRTAAGHTVQFEDGDDPAVTVVDGANGHVVRLDQSGITITDGANDGNQLTMTADGVSVTDGNGNAVVLGSGGIQIGKDASHPLIHGDDFKQAVTTFLQTLNTHTHLGNLGAPTSPPSAPMSLDVALSKHTVE